ncbi:SPW repeat protein [Labrys okinawensis]|uniref:SPW repeat protein n=1 Tax=Labrys okinawensis TaxID=346911 RepID=UPI0039BD7195
MVPVIFQSKRFQDVILLLLAIALFASPWVLGFADNEMAKWDAGVVAVILAYMAAASLSETRQWEEWVTLVLGAWLIAAPWVLRFISDIPATRLHWGIGALTIIVSLWAEWTYRHPPRLSAH